MNKGIKGISKEYIRSELLYFSLKMNYLFIKNCFLNNNIYTQLNTNLNKVSLQSITKKTKGQVKGE